MTAAILAVVLMISSAFAARLLTPTERLATRYASISLQQVVPPQFSDWRVDASIAPLAADPTVAAQLASIYSQTLSRTYINGDGRRVMLSIAYGGDQSRELQVHRPEVCYAAQGFKVQNSTKVDVRSGFGSVPAMQLQASKGGRQEPITYWVRIGDKVVRNVEQGLARMSYGFSGVIPDGLLVRVSTIGADYADQYEIQAGFVRSMLLAIEPRFRSYLIGDAGLASQ
jgi:EpsI family protein